jgi:uncharacterized protein YdeI (YjbR/CyaY-like superfamily)
VSDPIFFASAAELRQWFLEHHADADELLVGFFKASSGRSGVTYPEAVDQALCFGWIDGIRRSIDGERYSNRFTPRRRRSIWSQVNLRRFAALQAAGQVHEAGLQAFEARDPARTGLYSSENRPELGEAYERQLHANPAAWAFWQVQPPGYQRTATWWVISARREETRQRRLGTLIEDSAAGRRLAAVTSQRQERT